MKKLTLRNIMLCLALSFFASGAMANNNTLLDQTHAAKGLKCASCHGKAENRHFGTETDCLKCHSVHQKSENYCGSCHLRFDFVVP